MASFETQQQIHREVERQTKGDFIPTKGESIALKIMQLIEGKNLDQETLDFNIPFWVQALLRSPTTRLRIDAPNTVFYPQQDTLIPLTGVFIMDYLLQFVPPHIKFQYFISNFYQIGALFQAHTSEILRVLEKGNLIIVSNHASWLNLPLIAVCLERFCGVPREKIFTLLGPAITTRELAFSGIVSFSNVYKTVPDTPNGNIIGEKIIDKIRADMYKALARNFRVLDGKVLLLAPTGTTDSYDSATGTFSLPKVGDATFTLLERLGRTSNVLAIGVNDKQIMPSNSGLQRGEVYVGMGEIADGSLSEETVNQIPKLVLSSSGESIASWKK